MLTDKEHYQASKVALMSKEFDKARMHLRVLTEKHPEEASLWFNLGSAALECGDRVEALSAYQRVLEVDPLMADAYFNCGVLLASSNSEMAISCYERCIELSEHADAMYNLALLYIKTQSFEKAIVLLKRARGLGERVENIDYLLSSLSESAVASKAPERFVAELFDQYAERFESDLDSLGYQTPDLIVQGLSEKMNLSEKVICDLGCGTGLVGEAIGKCRELVGVDLSEKMLQKALDKGCYTALECADAVAYLKNAERSFDVVIAADVLVYFGELTPLFEAVRRRLNPKGAFAFSIELTDHSPFQLHKGARYAHYLGYVKNLGSMFGFNCIHEQSVILRYQHGQPVNGMILVLSL